MEHQLIMGRELTTLRPPSGEITAVTIVQRENGMWNLDINVSWKPNITYSVALYDTRRLLEYKLLVSALRHVYVKLDYQGTVSLHRLKGLPIANSLD
jgi:hypothetical protein